MNGLTPVFQGLPDSTEWILIDLNWGPFVGLYEHLLFSLQWQDVPMLSTLTIHSFRSFIFHLSSSNCRQRDGNLSGN
jgi:hypothetical protein